MIMRFAKKTFLNLIVQYIRNIILTNNNIGKIRPNIDMGQNKLGLINGDIYVSINKVNNNKLMTRVN